MRTPNTNPDPDIATQMNKYGSRIRNPGCDQLEPPTCTSRLKRKVLHHAKTEDSGCMALWKEYINANNGEIFVKPIAK